MNATRLKRRPRPLSPIVYTQLSARNRVENWTGWQRLERLGRSPITLATVLGLALWLLSSPHCANEVAQADSGATVMLTLALMALWWSGNRRPKSPLTKRTITSPMGWRIDPIDGGGQKAWHRGTDYRAPVGTPAFAPTDATVQVGEDASNGIYVFGSFDDSKYGPVTWMLIHLSSTELQTGAQVRRGEEVGRTGETGRSKGPHLHAGLKVGAAEERADFETWLRTGDIEMAVLKARELKRRGA